jgi:hypothetical protein
VEAPDFQSGGAARLRQAGAFRPAEKSPFLIICRGRALARLPSAARDLKTLSSWRIRLVLSAFG